MAGFLFGMIAVALAVIAAFFPGGAAVFVGLGIVGVAGIVMFRWREGVPLAAIVSGGPVIVSAFPLSPVVRGGTLLAFLFLVFWKIADMRARARGGPIDFDRLLLFFCAIAFAFFAALLASSEARNFPGFASVAAVAGTASGVTAFVRSSIERARGGGLSAVPILLDAIVVGLATAETYVALSFLSLSPLTLAAVLTVVLWAMSALVVEGRVGALTAQRAVRIGAIAAASAAALFLFVPWTTLR